MKSFANILVLCVVFLVTAKNSHAATSPSKAESAPSREDVLKRSSFEDFQGAANYLIAVVEASQVDGSTKQKVLPCDPKPETAQNWLSGPIHSLTDEKRDQEVEKYRRSPADFLKPVAGCLKTCSCNAYLEMLESFTDKLKENEIHQKNLKTAQKQAALESTEKSHACARKFKKFCGGLIEKYLKAEY